MSTPFAETRWTLVQRAQGQSTEAGAALAELCVFYYTPVYQYVLNWCGGRREDAEDLTQEFFARLLEKPQIDGASPEKGRFRSFVLGAVKHFLCDARDRARALKRGGGREHVPMLSEGMEAQEDGERGAGVVDLADPGAVPPDAAFDRQWALHVLERALESLEAAFEAEGKSAHFLALKPWLVSSQVSDEEAAAAMALGLKDGALRVAVHRLRQRFREQLRREVGQTLASESEVDMDAEMGCLLAALRG